MATNIVSDLSSNNLQSSKLRELLKRLADDVDGAMLDNCLRTGRFLPCDRLDTFVTRENVAEIINHGDDGELLNKQSLIEFVLQDARKLFLILVLITKETKELSSWLNDLYSNDIMDKLLPIEFRRADNGSHYGITTNNGDEKQFHFFDRWERNDRYLFETFQCSFLAPVFTGDPFHHQLHPKAILPYLKRPEVHKSASGFFGEVSRVEVHQAHVPQLIPNSTNGMVSVAIKKAKHGEELAEFFDREARNLRALCEYKSPYLIKPIAAYHIAEDRCLVFPWADGGNLGDYWTGSENQRSDPASVHWILQQFGGLFSALNELHKGNCRHGDLKPENILWFQDENGHGTLQIADLGLATFHAEEKNTKDRKGVKTLTPSGTSRYEPPEMDSTRETSDARSRQYDIWSMGCVALELLVWLVYGNTALDKFKSFTDHFWQPGDGAGKSPYRVHSYVVSCMRVMKSQLQDNGKDKTAYKDILSLIEKRLLVVAVSEDYVSSKEHREIAAVLCKQMAEIEENCRSSETYLVPLYLNYPSDMIREQQQHTPTGTSHLEVPGGRNVSMGTLAREERSSEENLPDRTIIRRPTGEGSLEIRSSSSIAAPEHQVSLDGSKLLVFLLDSSYFQFLEWDHTHKSCVVKQSHRPVDAWHSSPDNDFAKRYFDVVKWDDVKPVLQTGVPLLCDSCDAFDTSSIFNGVYNMTDLREKSSVCKLCEILYEALKVVDVGLSQSISIKQSGSTVSIDNGHDLLSLYSEPGPVLPNGTQLGLPALLPVESAGRFQLLKQLIRECDANHDLCSPKDDENFEKMPTRLIDIKDNIKLIESQSIKSSPYVALSHCWGSLQSNEKLCALRENIQDLRDSIKFERLPRTFRDAVTVARNLGMRYIWIDSLCIIQDDKKDWEYEAARMEQVFRGAYFTIAATSARTSNDGFLTHRQPRSFVQLVTPDGQKLYVCRAIDNFYKDVERGELNQRGWVLQERVLSRRSIHFSSNQIYWECGNGVHCETLTRLNNSKAAFLGDANFPTSALDYYRDGRQVLLQDLYERYSRLAFTVPSDRSVAILGLERRLARTFNTEAIFGLFAIYFGRGLLWQRGSPKRMKHISSKGAQRVPSWSWFSKEGSIKYMDLEFERIEWVTKDLRGPFIHKGKSSNTSSDSVLNELPDIFEGRARRLVLKNSELLVRISFDAEDEFDIKDLRCIVVGRDKAKHDGSQAQIHALIVHPYNTLDDAVYKRVGVGSLMAANVGDEVSWVSVW